MSQDTPFVDRAPSPHAPSPYFWVNTLQFHRLLRKKLLGSDRPLKADRQVVAEAINVRPQTYSTVLNRDVATARQLSLVLEWATSAGLEVSISPGRTVAFAIPGGE